AAARTHSHRRACRESRGPTGRRTPRRAARPRAFEAASPDRTAPAGASRFARVRRHNALGKVEKSAARGWRIARIERGGAATPTHRRHGGPTRRPRNPCEQASGPARARSGRRMRRSILVTLAGVIAVAQPAHADDLFKCGVDDRDATVVVVPKNLKP